MTNSDNDEHLHSDGTLEDVALNSMDDAIHAVQNETNTEVSTHVADPTDAFPELEEVEDPQAMVDGLLQIGEERSRAGDTKGALAAFNKAIALDPASDMAWFNRGVLLEAQQDARGARQAFQICLDLNDQHAPATANMAILLERIGDLDGAFEMANAALEFYPGHPALVQLQARCKDSGISVPIEAMKPSLEVQQDVDMNIVQKVAEEAGIEDAEELLQEAMHHDHDHDESLSVQELQSAAAVVVATQQISQEISESQPAPAPVPEVKVAEVNLDELSEQAKDWLKEGKAKEALQLLKPHLKNIGAQHASAWRIAGGAMARLDLDNHAIAAMNHAQNLEPTHAAGWFNLGSIQQRNGKLLEALNAYKRAMEADSAYVKAGEKMATLALEQGWLDHYLEACRSVITANPNHELKHKLVDTLIQLSSGEHEILEHTSGLPPTIPAGPELAVEALELLGDEPSKQRANALSLALQHSDAVLMWKSLIQTEQNDAQNWTGLAKALEMAGDLATATKCHAKAAALNSNLANDAPTTDPLVQPTTQTAPLAPEPSPTVATTPAVAEPPNPFTAQSAPVSQPPQPSANADLLLTPREPVAMMDTAQVAHPEVDLAKAALDAAQTVGRSTPQSTGSSAVANQDIAWFNQGVQLIEDGKYREALSSFDKALPAFAGNDEMIIRILNNRGNAYYFLEQYPKCVESYHQAMTIRPTEVRGETLYNMGTAYAEMERYNDAIKCFEQAIPRGLDTAASKRAKDQIRRCRILQKALEKKMKRRR